MQTTSNWNCGLKGEVWVILFVVAVEGVFIYFSWSAGNLREDGALLAGLATSLAIIGALSISIFQARRTEERRLKEQAPELVLLKRTQEVGARSVAAWWLKNIGESSAYVENIRVETSEDGDNYIEENESSTPILLHSGYSYSLPLYEEMDQSGGHRPGVSKKVRFVIKYDRRNHASASEELILEANRSVRIPEVLVEQMQIRGLTKQTIGEVKDFCAEARNYLEEVRKEQSDG